MPSRRASHSSAPKVVRKGLSDGQGLPATAAVIGTATQNPTHSSTAGSGEMSATTKPTTMAPYHHRRPRTRSRPRRTAARASGTTTVR